MRFKTEPYCIEHTVHITVHLTVHITVHIMVCTDTLTLLEAFRLAFEAGHLRPPVRGGPATPLMLLFLLMGGDEVANTVIRWNVDNLRRDVEDSYRHCLINAPGQDAQLGLNMVVQHRDLHVAFDLTVERAVQLGYLRCGAA